jgi:hypothetical protein
MLALSSPTTLADFGDRARRRVTSEFSEARRESVTADHLARLLMTASPDTNRDRVGR